MILGYVPPTSDIFTFMEKNAAGAVCVPHHPGPEYHRILQDRRITDELV